MLFPLFLAIAGMITACSNSGSLEVDTLEIQGVTWACNITSSYSVFGPASESEEQLKLVLPATEGDLLYMLLDDQQFYYRYRREDGTRLSITFDTHNTVSVYLNEHLEYVEFSGPSSLKAFSELTDAEVKQIATIYIQGSISEKLLSTLKQHETALPGKGIVLAGGSGTKNFDELFSLCRPKLLVLEDSWRLPAPEKSSPLSKLELLWINGELTSLANMVRCCGNLESLIISDWEPEPGELLRLSGLKKLHSLTIAESDLISLSTIEFPPSLSKLHLISCDTLSDISRLADLPDLTRLSLSQCKQLRDVDQLHQLNSLQWLAFPPLISHAGFKKLSEAHTQLEVVELIDCSEIVNMAPLHALPKLNTLILQMEKEQLWLIDSLKQLNTLILTDDLIYDNSEWIKDLRTSLADTEIVPGSGLCLGSGWILLLLPFILIFRHYFRHKK